MEILSTLLFLPALRAYINPGANVTLIRAKSLKKVSRLI